MTVQGERPHRCPNCQRAFSRKDAVGPLSFPEKPYVTHQWISIGTEAPGDHPMWRRYFQPVTWPGGMNWFYLCKYCGGL